MRIGVFGGTFDPIHQGHLILAEQCREQARLDQVWFVPAARPPHKQGQALTSFAHRAEMLALAIAGQPLFRMEDLEKDRTGLSFTADTLDELRQRHPGNVWQLVIGSDCLPDLPHWHDPQRILKGAGLVAVERPGWPPWSSEQLRAALSLDAAVPVELQNVEMPLFELSSRDLRSRIGSGRTIRYLVPRSVECYIETHGLYQQAT